MTHSNGAAHTLRLTLPSLEANQEKIQERVESLFDRLMNAYGPGDDKRIRTRFFEWVQDCCMEHGQAALIVVNRVAKAAAAARQPDRYFCRVVKDELVERNLVPKDDSSDNLF